MPNEEYKQFINEYCRNVEGIKQTLIDEGVVCIEETDL